MKIWDSVYVSIMGGFEHQLFLGLIQGFKWLFTVLCDFWGLCPIPPENQEYFLFPGKIPSDAFEDYFTSKCPKPEPEPTISLLL